MLNVSVEDFEALVSDGLDTLPDEMFEHLDNVIFLVEDVPEDGSDVLGTYDGFSLLDREAYGFGEQPDRITLYRKNLLSHCSDEEELRKEIRITLVHEVAHFLGLTEERIHELGWG